MNAPQHRVAPVLGASYLMIIAVGAFVLTDVRLLAGLVALQLVLGAWRGMRARPLFQPFRKLVIFSLVIILSYGLIGTEGEKMAEVTVHLPLWPWPLSVTGMWLGLTMVLRVFAVVTTSAWLRIAGEPGDLLRGLRALGMPKSVAELIDYALFLLEAAPEARKQRGGGKSGAADNRFSVRGLLRGEFGFFIEAAARYLRQAAAVAEERGAARDVVILAGLLMLMLSVKAVKILPGLPFAPGYKGVILLPVYILAVRLTRGRFCATELGAAFGILSFLFGDGRYGALEILKHIAPGVLADIFAFAIRGPVRSLFTYCFIGMVLAVGRWATIASVVLLVEAPPMVAAVLAPVGLVHLVFGACSGLMTRVLVGATSRFDATINEALARPAEGPPAEDRAGNALERRQVLQAAEAEVDEELPRRPVEEGAAHHRLAADDLHQAALEQRP